MSTNPQNRESLAAFERTKFKKSEDSQAILQCLGEHPQGLTREEIGRLTRMRTQTCSARCSELRSSGLIVEKATANGTYERRRTSSGSLAAVMVLGNPDPSVLPTKETLTAESAAQDVYDAIVELQKRILRSAKISGESYSDTVLSVADEIVRILVDR